ncbi:hypothetical protein [Leadbetterella sp. DM7]|uniref:hypothetical protein n=1 Tax=Leadbetterella sp. DM7 TaxID=3235085 RepID=UPI00349EDDB9
MKFLRIPAVIVLMVLPYLAITEQFFPPGTPVDNSTFGKYILICMGSIALGVLLMRFLKPESHNAGWLLFAIGLIVIIPLHLGPPRMGPELQAATGIERLRFTLLIAATLLLFMAGLKVIAPLRSTLSKITLAVLCIMLLLSVWNSGSLFLLSFAGQNPDTAAYISPFPGALRSPTRILVYATAALLAFLLSQKGEIKKWQWIGLTVICLIGIVMCILYGQDPRIPFMVPAIALAPAYWLGIALLANKRRIYNH